MKQDMQIGNHQFYHLVHIVILRSVNCYTGIKIEKRNF